MKLRLETRYAADALGLKIRWALLLAAGMMAFDHLASPVVICGLAFFAISNLIGHRLCSSHVTYEAIGKQYMKVLRWIDGLVIAGSTLVGGVQTDHLYLLTVLVLLSEALVWRNRWQVLLFASILAIVQAVTLVVTKAPPNGFILPIGTILLSAAAGIVLSTFQSREEILSSRDRRLSSVLECGSALAANGDLSATILHTLRSAILEAKATCGYVMLLDDNAKNQLVTEAAFSAEGEFKFPERIEIGSGMSGYVAKMGQPIAISSKDAGGHEYDGVTAGVRSAACVPLVTRGYTGAGQATVEQVMGVMTLLDLENSDSFNADDMELLRTLGSLIAVAVANARMEERRRTTFLRTLESLATALEARDEYTRGHSQRVCEVSLMIGERMGFGPDAIEELRIGTILHDIGKIGVPDEILNKRGRLTDEEFATMKTHPVIGYEICMPLMLSEGVLMIIRNHHEKLDGSGYPDGLKGGELPLSLRIVCVADAFDAMSSRRPYRGVMETSTVLAELSKGAGTQFDPVVVEALKELMNSDRMHDLYKQYWGGRDQQAA